MKRFALFATALLAFSCLPGCEFFSQFTSPKNQLVEQIAIQYATGKYIEGEKQPAERVARAVRVGKVAADIKAVAGADDATIAALRELAAKQIAGAKLSPADSLLANTLVDAVVLALSEKVASGVLSPDAKVAVDKLLDWVIAAAAAYGS